MHVSPTTGPTLVSLDYDKQGVQPTGTETVMRVATTAAGSFNYFYDAQNRRVRKQYPNGDMDGYFWGEGKALLMETAPTSVGSERPTMDEYVWLGGQAVFSIRAKYSGGPTWERGSEDWQADCARRSEAGTCRPNAIITDVIGKPIATVDSARRVAGVLEYDAYGAANRAEHWGEIAPAQNAGCWWVASWMKQGTAGPLVRQVRALVPRVDLNEYVPGVKGGCIGQYKSHPWQSPYSAPAGNDFCGPRTEYRFPWTSLSGEEGLHVLYCSYETNVSPQPFGVTVRGYEYRKTEEGASHYVPPLRFPGQYFDEETGLHENWNRYYEPATGTYLSPEPLLQNPRWVASELRAGHQVPAYAYARNNPVAYTDPNGLNPGAGAAAGASVGSVAGPVGAAVGATVGAVAGTAAAAAVASAVSNAPPINWAGTEPGAGVPEVPIPVAPATPNSCSVPRISTSCLLGCEDLEVSCKNRCAMGNVGTRAACDAWCDVATAACRYRCSRGN